MRLRTILFTLLLTACNIDVSPSSGDNTNQPEHDAGTPRAGQGAIANAGHEADAGLIAAPRPDAGNDAGRDSLPLAGNVAPQPEGGSGGTGGSGGMGGSVAGAPVVQAGSGGSVSAGGSSGAGNGSLAGTGGIENASQGGSPSNTAAGSGGSGGVPSVTVPELLQTAPLERAGFRDFGSAIRQSYGLVAGLGNATTTSVLVKQLVIAGRPPGGTHAGGPFKDFSSSTSTPVILPPGGSISIVSWRVFQDDDLAGNWEVYLTWQDVNNQWHDFASRVLPVASFTPAMVLPYAPQVGDPNVAVTAITYENLANGRFTIQVRGTGTPNANFYMSQGTECQSPPFGRDFSTGARVAIDDVGNWLVSYTTYNFQELSLAFNVSPEVGSGPGTGPCKYFPNVLRVPSNP